MTNRKRMRNLVLVFNHFSVARVWRPLQTMACITIRVLPKLAKNMSIPKMLISLRHYIIVFLTGD
jgi:hypothetical protein